MTTLAVMVAYQACYNTQYFTIICHPYFPYIHILLKVKFSHCTQVGLYTVNCSVMQSSNPFTSHSSMPVEIPQLSINAGTHYLVGKPCPRSHDDNDDLIPLPKQDMVSQVTWYSNNIHNPQNRGQRYLQMRELYSNHSFDRSYSLLVHHAWTKTFCCVA